MRNIQVEGKTLEPHEGRNVDTAPALLKRWRNGEGYIPSEADIRLMGVRNFGNAPKIANTYWDTSTFSATKGKDVKVILPYDNSGDYKLTDAAELGLSLINSNERLVNYEVNLDVDERWDRLNGRGVYTLKRKGLVLNRSLTEEQAMEHPLILTKLGHPNYVDSEFARPIEEIEEIVGRTFELGKSEHDYNTMMGQLFSDLNKKGILKAWGVGRLGGRSRASGRGSLDDDAGRFVFASARGAEGKSGLETYNSTQIEDALNELGFSGLTKTLIDKLGDRK